MLRMRIRLFEPAAVRVGQFIFTDINKWLTVLHYQNALMPRRQWVVSCPRQDSKITMQLIQLIWRFLKQKERFIKGKNCFITPRNKYEAVTIGQLKPLYINNVIELCGPAAVTLYEQIFFTWASLGALCICKMSWRDLGIARIDDSVTFLNINDTNAQSNGTEASQVPNVYADLCSQTVAGNRLHFSVQEKSKAVGHTQRCRFLVEVVTFRSMPFKV